MTDHCIAIRDAISRQDKHVVYAYILILHSAGESPKNKGGSHGVPSSTFQGMHPFRINSFNYVYKIAYMRLDIMMMYH